MILRTCDTLGFFDTRRLRRLQLAQRRIMVIKYAGDTRYDSSGENHVSTHDLQKFKAYPVKDLAGFKRSFDFSSVDVIGIDEGQFFSQIAPFCDDLANQGKIVIVAALDGTFERQPFGGVLELVPLSEEVTKLKAVCQQCGDDAVFSQRTSSEKEVEVVGGADKYQALCRACFFPHASK